MRALKCRGQESFKTWLIEPQTGDLSWAEGTVPTPYGPIEVKWRKTSKRLRLEIEVPAGTSGTVGVPTSSDSDVVTDNGGPRGVTASAPEDAGGGRPGYAYLQDLGSGAHSIQVTGAEK